MIVGYARVSTTDQDLSIQLEKLRDAGAEKIFAERKSGKDSGREQLRDCLDFVREGDVLVVTRLDRLGRSLKDLLEILAVVNDKNVAFRCTEQALDTSTIEGRLMFSLLGAFAEFETDLRRARQEEGIAKAKALGKYRSRGPRVNVEEIVRLRRAGWGTKAIAEKLNVNAATVNRYTPADLKEVQSPQFAEHVRRQRERRHHDLRGSL